MRLATDEHRCTQITGKPKRVTHLCASVFICGYLILPVLPADRCDKGAIALAFAIAVVVADGELVGRRDPPARNAALALVALLVHLDQESVDQCPAGPLALFGARDAEDVVPALVVGFD